MFYLVQVSSKTKTVGEYKTYRTAVDKAIKWSAVTGLAVEIQNEIGEILETIRSWAERDYHD